MGANNTVGAGKRMFDVIEALKERTSAGVTELAAVLDMPKSTVYVHLSTLKEQGFVVQDDEQRYRLSLKFLDIGMMVRESQEMYEQVVPKLDELANETDEKAWWIVEENGAAVFLAKSLGDHAIRTSARIGHRTELYRLAGGMAILSVLPDERREKIVSGYEFPLPDGRTRSAFDAELEQIKKEGIATQSGRFLQGVHGVGAPIRDNHGTVYGAISLSGPAGRFTSERIDAELVPLVVGIAGELQINLSYS